ncbi:MAG: pantoate--beta-alanine ligase [Desulfuromonadaceae bacterium]|nr:pantoate--beta-alanine ligase [Desulfuromonas sp.]MDY0186235.1 pantoate--beta-alanine ligase [Desulfuromonadaceae bacterium]
METIRQLDEMQARALALRTEGKRIVFVPTMGYLHEGHLSLVRAARNHGEVVVLSIFVNPIQFGAGEDFASYPRDLSRDSALAAEAGVDIIFAPEASQMYPAGYATSVHVEGITETLCGASRPGHFDGVTTVVSKLFGIVQPHSALFGMKDFQQLAVIRRMTVDLNLPIEIIGMPIVREADGLALSSRNKYLTPHLHQQALCLQDAIRMATDTALKGEKDAAAIIALVQQRIQQEGDTRIDYIQICNAKTLQEVTQIDVDAVLLLAVHFGPTRLIDNHYLLTPFN